MADIVYTNADTAARRANDPEIQQTLDAAYQRYQAGAQDGTIFTDQYGKVTNFGASAGSNQDAATRVTSGADVGTTTPPSQGGLMSGPTFSPAAKKNILHNYRSWAYNFSMGAIDPVAVSNISLVRSSIKKYAVLNSAGKGSQGLSANTAASQFNPNVSSADTKGLIDGFNANSPGRFDLYIDNVEIESIITAGTKGTGASTSALIKFDVFEPYSMNGFIEALQVASKAAGYTDYVKACFGLQFEFQGYPDNQPVELSKPELIPNSTRYFVVNITEVDVDVTEQGTKYRVTCVPTNQMGFGETNNLKSDINVEGNTVKEVLSNFFKSVNENIQNEVKKARDGKNVVFDTYELSCPAAVSPGTQQDVKAAMIDLPYNGAMSPMVQAKMNDDLKSANIFKAGDPAKAEDTYDGAKGYTPTSNATPTATGTSTTGDPVTGKTVPRTGLVVFKSTNQIHDCIAAVVRDSKWVEEKVLSNEALTAAKQPGSDGMLPYFTVRLETSIKGYDSVANKYLHNYRYVLEPYKIHYTKIPGQEQGTVDVTALKKKIERSYDYIYTGKNLDIQKFQLKFNNLYFTAVPAMMGNRLADPNATKAAGTDATQAVGLGKSNAVGAGSASGKGSMPTASVLSSSEENQQPDTVAGQTQSNPYYKLAQTLHNAVLNSVDMITGTLDIYGDPYFLVTGGMVTENLKLNDPYLKSNGEAATTQGALYINVNFRNPIDIGSDGMMKFDPELVGFSGVYQVITLKSNFKDGLFTQSLDIVRMPGQVPSSSTAKPANNLSTRELPSDKLVKDTALATVNKQGIRPSTFSLGSLFGSGFQSPGLPGIPVISGILNQVQGAVGQATSIASQLGVNPTAGLNALSSGIRLAASGLAAIPGVNSLTAAAGTVASSAATLGSLANVPNSAGTLATGVVNSVKGVGDTVTALGEQAVTGISNAGTAAYNSIAGLGQSISNLGSDIASTVGNAKDNIYAVLNPALNDPAAVAAKLGIDPAAIAGLSADVANKLTAQLAEVAKLVPDNVNLGSLDKLGIDLSNISQAQLPNLPSIAKLATAPTPLADPAFPFKLSPGGKIVSVIPGVFPDIADATNINKIANEAGLGAVLSPTGAFGQLTAGLNAGLGTAKSLLGAAAAAQSQVNNVIGSTLGVTNAVGSLGQNALGAVNAASVGLGSIESNITNLANVSQNITQATADLAQAATTQFGSLQQSPITKLMQSTDAKGTA